MTTRDILSYQSHSWAELLCTWAHDSISPRAVETVMAALPESWAGALEARRADYACCVCLKEDHGCPQSERWGNHSHSGPQYELH